MKNCKKILAVLLAVLCSFTALTAAVAAEDAFDGEMFIYGEYPQSRVTDTDLVARLNRRIAKADDNHVLTLGGKRYMFHTVEGNSVPGGSNFATAYGYALNDTYWFAFEPIRWRVLERSDDKLLLMADSVLDTHTFNDGKDDVVWANSGVKTWLNETFYEMAFKNADKTKILSVDNLTLNRNPVRYHDDVYAVDFPLDNFTTSQDKIFLPSFLEITEQAYGFNLDCPKTARDDWGMYVGYYETDPARQACGTDFAKCKGVWANLVGGKPDEHCRYWLRTPGFEANYAAAVLEDGRVSTGWEVDYTVVGVRPMMYVAADAVSGGPTDPGETDDPIHILIPGDGTYRYGEPDLVLTVEGDIDVIWESSDPTVIVIDEDGNVTVVGVGTVTITATSVDDPTITVSQEITIRYTWWQWFIIIFLFGWIWYIH